MSPAQTAALQAKRDEVVAHIDRCLTLAPNDSVRALAAIDEARKGCNHCGAGFTIST